MEYGFAFPAHNVSASTTIHELIGWLISHLVILYKGDQGTQFIAKEFGNLFMSTELAGLTTYLLKDKWLA